MTIESADNVSLEIRRIIKAPRARVYAAWTDPAELQQWFGPAGVQTMELTAEVRVGGKYRWQLKNADGEEMAVEGEYRELEPDRRVVFSWQWQDDEEWAKQVSVVTVELADAAGGTELRLRHEKLPSEPSRDRHTQGWESVLDNLENFCRDN